MAGPLAQKIRAKYPGAYDDMDDAALEKAILAKYPEYADLVEPDRSATAPTQEKSLSGFAGNIVKSGGRLIKDVASAPYALFQMDQALKRDPLGAAEAALGAVKGIPAAFMARYGGLEQIKNTAYEDPIGMLGDVSTVAGAAGLLTKGAPKIAGVLRRVSDATNPLVLPGKLASKVADKASTAVIKGTLRPSKAIRDDFGGADAVADTVKRERVFSEASSSKKLAQSSARADAMLAEAEAKGAPGVPRAKVANALRGQPAKKAAARARLGEPNQIDEIDARAAQIEGGGGDYSLTDAQALKREAQELAYEAGADNLSVKKAQQQAIARALREGIEEQVPAVGPVNERTQGLIGANRAFADAQDRPNALVNMMALGAGGTVGAGTGDPLQAISTALAMKATNSPRVGAMTGIAINELGQAALDPNILRAALIARLTGQQ